MDRTPRKAPPIASPEFYIRLSDEERFGIVRMGEHKGNRVVEKLTIEPVIKETTQEPDLVEMFRQQVADGLFKIWPQKPLDPGEYAVVEYTEGEAGYAGLGFFHRAGHRETQSASSQRVGKIPSSSARKPPSDIPAAPAPCPAVRSCCRSAGDVEQLLHRARISAGAARVHQ